MILNGFPKNYFQRVVLKSNDDGQIKGNGKVWTRKVCLSLDRVINSSRLLLSDLGGIFSSKTVGRKGVLDINQRFKVSR